MKRTKLFISILCALLFTFGSSLMVFADNTYTHIFTYTFIGSATCIRTATVVTPYEYVAMVGFDTVHRLYYCDGENCALLSVPDGTATSITTVDDIYDRMTFNYLRVTAEYTLGDYVGIPFYASESEFLSAVQNGTYGIEEPTTEESTTEEPSTESGTEEPTTEEPSTESGTEEPTTEEPSTEPNTEEPSVNESNTNTDAGLASALVSDLIGTNDTFTPQSVMCIFVVCLVLECISHIASSLINVQGGLK